MKLKYRPMAIMGFSSLFVLFLCTYFDDRLSFAAIAAGIVLLVLCTAFSRLRQGAVLFLISAALIFSGVSFEVLSDYKISYSESLIDKELSVCARVLDEPEFSNSKYYYTVETLKIDNRSFKVKARISSPNYIEAEPYDIIEARVKFYDLGSYSKDIKLYYHSKGIFLGGYLSYGEKTEIKITVPEKKPLRCQILSIRRTVEERILDKLPNCYGAVTVGMLTGNKEYIPDNIYGDIKGAGVAPVFAVSGMHLSVWVMGLCNLLGICKVRKRIYSAIGIGFVILFMAVTGFTASVCRSGIMLITVLSGNLFYRRADSINSLGLAALLLGIINPLIVADIGFLLSFSSTLGIVALSPIFNEKLCSHLPQNPLGKCLRMALDSIIISVCATIGSLGFTAVFIGYVSVYSVLSNLLISYAASVCMLTGGMCALLYPLTPVADGFAVIAGVLSKYIIVVVGKIAQLPFATVTTSNIYWTAGVIFAYTLAIIIYVLFKFKAAHRIFCAALAILLICDATLYYFKTADYDTVTVLDTDEYVNLVIRNGKNSYVFLSGESFAYTADGVVDAIDNGDTAQIVAADTVNGEGSAMLSVIKKVKPEKLVLPWVGQSTYMLCPAESVVTATKSNIMLQNGSSAVFASASDYCVVVCSLQGVRLTAILRAEEADSVPEEYLSGDIIVCTKVPDGANFHRVIFVGESSDRILSTADYGNIDIKIKDKDYKIILKEER